MSRVSVADDGGDTMKAIDVGNMLAPGFSSPEEYLELYNNIPNLEIRDDDIMLCTYVKTGLYFCFIFSFKYNCTFISTNTRVISSSLLFKYIEFMQGQ